MVTGKRRSQDLSPEFHFSFGSANQRVASDAFIYEGWKALNDYRRLIDEVFSGSSKVADP